jgi:hypothetical protein
MTSAPVMGTGGFSECANEVNKKIKTQSAAHKPKKWGEEMRHYCITVDVRSALRHRVHCASLALGVLNLIYTHARKAPLPLTDFFPFHYRTSSATLGPQISRISALFFGSLSVLKNVRVCAL